jgi:hypothetical protein
MDSPRISTLSHSEHELLSTFVEQSLTKDWSHQRQTLQLLLYLADAKPATEFSQVYRGTSESDIPPVESEGFPQLIEAFALPHERIVTPLTDGLLAVCYECLPSDDATLPPQAGEDASYHRAWGAYYGYPESAITAFVNGECLRYATHPKDRQRLYEVASDAGISQNRLQKLPLVAFLPPATPRGLRDTVQSVTAHEAVIDELATQHGVTTARPLVRSIIENQPRPTRD